MTTPSTSAQSGSSTSWRIRLCGCGWVAAIAALLVVLGIAGESVVALAVVVMDGSIAWLALGVAALAGAWLPGWLGVGRDQPGDRYLLGAALGIGLLSLAVLCLGSAGWLTRPVAIGLLLVCGAAGLLRVRVDTRLWIVRQQSPIPAEGHPAWNLLALIIVPCLVIALLAASLPPGIIWQEEGFGYDVLSYHLAAPKTWFEQGRVSVLPYNVYSDFPFNSEMLSLLMMVLRGDAIEAAFMAQLVNVGLGALFVAGAWKLGRLYGRLPAIVAAVAAGTCPWLTYLCGIAYDEPGMLAMGMAALWAAMKAGIADEPQRGRWVLCAGLLAGLACGYKYTALPLIALPIGMLLVMTLAERWSRRTKHLAMYAAACLAMLSPWLIRNAVTCGNPVYPLGYSVFGAKPGWWDDELEERWQQAHGTARTEQTQASMLLRVWLRTLAEPRTGALLWALAVGGVCLRRDRRTLALLAVLALQITVWIAATHLFARFACVLLLPLIALAARMVERPMARRTAGLFAGVLLIGGGLNLYHAGRLYYDHTRIGPARQSIDAYGRTNWFEQGDWPGTQYIGAINALKSPVHVMLVGEARTFYLRRPCTYASAFNHHPLALAARELPDDTALMNWLVQRGVSHVLFHWDEIQRLKATYGMDGAMNAGLLPRLEAGGLKHVTSFGVSQDSPPYASLFEVPTHE